MVLYGHKGRSLLREKRIPDVIDCAKVSGSVSNHPTEKPIELLKIFIGNNSDEGQIVFDGFAGVSSTCMAAKELNRKFIGIELDKGYFDVAVERIKEKNKITLDKFNLLWYNSKGIKAKFV